MDIYYSKSTGGFYDREIHGDAIPADAVEITAEQHAALINGQAQGKIIAADENGFPVLQDPPPPSDDQLRKACKDEARKLLADTDFSELPSVRASISNASEFDAYRVAVRALCLNPVPAPEFPPRPAADWVVQPA